MDLRRLHHFSIVAENGSLHRAARKLGLRQPALSQSIRALEAEVHARLFDRGPSGTRLTRAGEAFLGEIRNILAALDRAVRIAQQAGAGTPLRLGIAGDIATTRLTETLRQFRQNHPQDVMIIGDGSTRRHLTMLDSGMLDLALLPATMAARAQAETVWWEEVHLALPAAHPLAKEGVIDLRRLADCPVIAGSSDPPTAADHALISACRDAGIEFRVAATTRDLEVRLVLVAAGFGGSALPALSPALADATGIVGRPLHPPVRIAVAAAWPQSGLTPAVQRFLDLARSSTRNARKNAAN